MQQMLDPPLFSIPSPCKKVRPRPNEILRTPKTRHSSHFRRRNRLDIPILVFLLSKFCPSIGDFNSSQAHDLSQGALINTYNPYEL